ncbi:MAG TPA: peptidase S10 [Gammaproteobacteria bacterium]|nr:peptidase S10 [Gammaproteobacteria bacterium]
MKKYLSPALLLLLAVYAGAAIAADAPPAKRPAASTATATQEEKSVTQGSVTVEGQRVDYDATAGTIILKNKDDKPIGSMFYIAYTKRGANPANRPVTFFYNGGPGSSTVWLHMGAFGPQRVVTADHTHTPAAPYGLVNNDYSLLDATDEVFIDAMGTGYSRIIGKDEGGAGEPKDFYGVDADVASFAQFIRRYLSDNGRWNSPKYLFGESYGTPRSAALVNYLLQRDDVDMNGVILLSSILDFRTASFNAGNDLPFELFLPSYTAVAWYHHKLPNPPAELQPLLQQVQQFALGDYARALDAGSTLTDSQFDAIAEKLHTYTGLSTAYIEKAKLRVNASQFEHELLNDNDTTVGRLDARFTGPTMNPLSEVAYYDPQSAAISSAYVSAFNHYVHNTLKFGRDRHYLPEAFHKWDWTHQNPTTGQAWPGTLNTAVDLTEAMKYNPDLQVLVNSGYFDLATPYFATDYTMDHLPIPKDLQNHIHMKYYNSGHMVYVHVPALKQLHDNAAAFIRNTDNVK